jgi:2,3-bisphosphoglycerate-independent phosphoglycerate mutase
VVEALVILDGASEPLGLRPTSLELARTPVLDRLAREGTLVRLRTIAAGLPAGSESAIPALLGWTPPQPVDRGALEAAAYAIVPRAGRRAWRVDVVAPAAAGARAGTDPVAGALGGDADARPAGAFHGAGRPATDAVDRAAAALRAGAPEHEVHRLAGHRLLLVGPAPLPAAARAASLRAWPEGVVPPRLLGPETVVVGARGAAIGIARLMGAATIVPAGATGRPRSDLAAKAAAAIGALGGGAARVVVHVGGPDEAAHLGDRAAKIAVIERTDRELVGALAEAVRDAGGALRVCPDHGCDPATGEHDSAPVPCVAWAPGYAGRAPVRGGGDRVGADGGPRPTGEDPARRLTERAVAWLPAVDLPSATPLVAA